MEDQYFVEQNNEDKDEYSFSKEEIAVFEQRREKRLSGKSEVYSWEEAKAIIIANKSIN
jgi:hypothetical protein